MDASSSQSSSVAPRSYAGDHLLHWRDFIVIVWIHVVDIDDIVRDAARILSEKVLVTLEAEVQVV